MGKGSTRRPAAISKEIADLRYELAFGSKEQKEHARTELVKLGVIK